MTPIEFSRQFAVALAGQVNMIRRERDGAGGGPIDITGLRAALDVSDMPAVDQQLTSLLLTLRRERRWLEEEKAAGALHADNHRN